MIPAYIGLGSNVADPVRQIKQAIEAIERHPDLTLVCHSSLYSTPPWGPIPQPNYINAVVKITTSLSPEALLSELFIIEQQQGRNRAQEQRFGPRTLDCDLLLYGDHSMTTEHLELPHPRMKERGFVMMPLAEIAPNECLPCGERIIDLVTKCDGTGIEKLC